MRALRSDAARSRERILEAARACDRGALRLNDVAREAGLGVGTVYRHFPTVHSLVEALSYETLERMLQLSRDASAEPDASAALERFLGSALELQLEDGGLQSVLLAPDDEAEGVRDAKREIFTTFTTVLDRARAAGAVRPDLTVTQIEHLICGVEHAVRVGSPADREPFLRILLAGLRP
ncbi:helix-turn-helix domain containing protein [Microbacterium sp. STN6]|uniref:TetR/AcrR family transcriptional regulator n=1 Tax=Microbacterium sp. STN6 TaxID=2995588 RepID=UPI0022609813|nr:TetR/AcrR family transcriptional regulator [Microbacterium sp. STN6]MCX7523045.1 helix-turn-helix domain containing protein [Microbacterium sp. STN6]